MLGELLRYRSFIKNLVLKDLKLKYRDSVLGFVWSLLNPLLLLSVYTVAFKYVLRIQMENYAYFLLVGLLPWTFFSTSLLASTGSIVGNGNLIKKVYFPREILPISTVLFCFTQLLLALAVFLPALMLLSAVPVHWTFLLLFPLLTLHVLFTIGMAFLLSALTTAFRDVAHLTEVGLLLLFWVTPVIYAETMAPAALQVVFRVSPAAVFSIAYHDVLFWSRVPDPLTFVALLGWTVAVLFLGRSVFTWYSPAFAEDV